MKLFEHTRQFLGIKPPQENDPDVYTDDVIECLSHITWIDRARLLRTLDHNRPAHCKSTHPLQNCNWARQQADLILYVGWMTGILERRLGRDLPDNDKIWAITLDIPNEPLSDWTLNDDLLFFYRLRSPRSGS